MSANAAGYIAPALMALGGAATGNPALLLGSALGGAGNAFGGVGNTGIGTALGALGDAAGLGIPGLFDPSSTGGALGYDLTSGTGGVGGSTGPLGGIRNAIGGVLGKLGMSGAPAAPSQQAVASALSSNPALAGVTPGMVAPGQTSSGNSTDNNGAWVGFGDTAAAYAKYLTDRQDILLGQRTAYTSGHSTPGEALPQLGILPAAPFALPRI
jgi:hypothetical protein